MNPLIRLFKKYLELGLLRSLSDFDASVFSVDLEVWILTQEPSQLVLEMMILTCLKLAVDAC